MKHYIKNQKKCPQTEHLYNLIYPTYIPYLYTQFITNLA